MERSLLFLILSGAGVLYMASRASSQYFEDPAKFYKNMTFDYDVRLRGGLGVPHCVNELMNCWEVMKAEIFCAHHQHFETACMIMKQRRCHEVAPFGELGWPYDNFHMIEQFCDYYLDQGFTRRRMKLAWDAWGITD